MPTAHPDLARYRRLLRQRIRQRGLTYRAVEDAMGWDRKYVGRLLRGEQPLRMVELLAILSVLGVEPGDFFRDLYGLPSRRRRLST